ncbi:restriction endonuclease subunit S [Pedobacter rhodius]|uniref:Restriction endonuclease subunit S n=1 Tax=Pedobacter rhodius TaxID=3004098 RepID=A0ABT4KWL8_9SPHI|nr:restriction endonuclease subunit S [Pedobacter sp. SJ11]MCZ4223309.1 restriction endonuclease subunit S [Pedobacter sp. SJ11]
MQSNYKRLGDYIKEVNIRNRDLNNYPLLGVSIKKVLMPSIANIIGTDMSTYKLIKKNQFAYGPVTSRNGDKISIALAEKYENALLSQAYTVFEVVDKNELHPEYLMMWFKRAEFDRYARFMSHGSAREIFSWAEMCDTLLPIPSPEKQLEIVSEYKIIQNRIQLNNQLINKLEETAQAIYKQWFVDFEFPDENGLPYKSNGGEMVYDKNESSLLPKEWKIKSISNIIDVRDGTHDSPVPVKIGFPLVTSTHLKSYSISINETYNISLEDFININKRSRVEKHDILFSMIGTVGLTSYVLYDEVNFAIKNVALFRTSKLKGIGEYVLFFLKSEYMKLYLSSNPKGSTQNYVTLNFLREMPIVLPHTHILNNFEKVAAKIIKKIHLRFKENDVLSRIENLILAKMTKIEMEEVAY